MDFWTQFWFAVALTFGGWYADLYEWYDNKRSRFLSYVPGTPGWEVRQRYVKKK